MPSSKQACFIIAEAGVNHNGSVDTALRLVDAAAEAGADAVKFQTFRASELASPLATTAAYQKAAVGIRTQYEMLKALELSEKAFARIAGHCAGAGVEFVSTPFSEQAADFLTALGVRRLKIPSGELTNLPFLRFLAGKGLPLILSTGMGDLEEVREAVETMRGIAHSPSLTVLHCTSNYPAALEDVNLRAMQTMGVAFGVPVGYSDHTSGVAVAPLARVLGATVIEKHFTLDRTLPGPDHAASLEPDALAKMVRAVREVDVVLGDGVKRPTAPEQEMRIAARRSVVLLVDAGAGETLSTVMLGLKRPGDGIAPKDIGGAIGRRLRIAKRAGEPVRHGDLLP